MGDWDINATSCYLFKLFIGVCRNLCLYYSIKKKKTCVCIIDFLVGKRDISVVSGCIGAPFFLGADIFCKDRGPCHY